MLEFDAVTDYAHVRVRRDGNTRSLSFVRDGGVEAVQSFIDVSRPHELKIAYLRRMSESPRYCRTHESVLLVGLGGGSLAHYYRRHYPEVFFDAVEVDPIIIDVAGKFFGVKGINITCADAQDFLRTPGRNYDVIYFDAFLPPSSETSGSGRPLFARSPAFLGALQRRLAAGGVAAFNCQDGRDDVRDICRAFRTSYILPAGGVSVVIGAS